MDLTIEDVFDQRPLSYSNGVYSFLSSITNSNYTDNWSKQWLRFRDTQLDSHNGTTISRDYLSLLLGGPLESLASKTVLEIGAGAGRFTEYFTQYARQVVAVDYSEAIYCNIGLNHSNVLAVRADLLNMPRMKMKFDLVYCRGVLQHTPDPLSAMLALHQWVTPEGYVAFDCYNVPSRPLPKYIWRPVIKRLFTYNSFSEFLDRYAKLLLKIRWSFLTPIPQRFRRYPRAAVNYLIPLADYRWRFSLNEEQLIEWSKMDTLDAMFAHYDYPQRPEVIIHTLKNSGVELLFADHHKNIFRSRPGVNFAHPNQ